MKMIRKIILVFTKSNTLLKTGLNPFLGIYTGLGAAIHYKRRALWLGEGVPTLISSIQSRMYSISWKIFCRERDSSRRILRARSNSSR